jgi:DNA repair exonuclease SbcCD ATPase subunit
MNHLTMDTLVSMREPGAEPGQAAAREHLDACPHCQAELERLHQRVARLKALPTLRPARDRWPETRARFQADRRRRRTRVASLAGLAAAASVAVALSVGELSQPESMNAGQLVQVMERSQLLESALNDYNPDGRVLDGGTARIAGELEDRIARLDRELEMAELQSQQQTTNEELLRLWRERVGLLDALVDVRVARASNAGL